VVVLVAQDARHLAVHQTWRGLADFTVVFVLVWIAWLNGSLHHELHGREDVRARSTFLLQILVLAAMGAFIPEADGGRGAAFAVAAAVLFAVLTGLWLLASRGDRPEYRRSSRIFVSGTAACAVLLAGTAFLPASARVLSWGVIGAAYVARFAGVLLTANTAVTSALTITDALIERFGLLIIIVLGEILTGVVAGLASQPVGPLTLSVGFVAVVVGFGAWWTYFDFAGHRQPRSNIAASMQWMLSHLPLTAAVAAMGAAMVSLIDRCRAVRHDARIGELAGLGYRPRPVPAAGQDLRRRGRGVPGARGHAAGPTRARPRTGLSSSASHGVRSGAPPGGRGRRPNQLGVRRNHQNPVTANGLTIA
jgi:low temperature requirement protein LtrA